jgi:prepilin-type N-terminal cleavage/methylation domain-containing protein
MKKLNKKGFTLIELLAVVVILLAISVIAVSSISAAIERNKVKQDEARKEIIISYAKLYYEDYKNTLEKKTKDANGNIHITMDELMDNEFVTEEELVDADGKIISTDICFKSGGKNFKFCE